MKRLFKGKNLFIVIGLVVLAVMGYKYKKAQDEAEAKLNA